MSDSHDIPIGYGNCHGCWRHKSGALWFDPTCPVHSPTHTEPGTTQTAADMAWEALARDLDYDHETPSQTCRDAIARHRPAIEAEARAAHSCANHDETLDEAYRKGVTDAVLDSDTGGRG